VKELKKNKVSLILPMTVMLVMLCVTAPSAASTDPHITVDKSVSPTDIYLKGDGGMPDTAKVILSIKGAGDPIPGKETYSPADVVFCVDDTGSMDGVIGNVQTQINSMTDTLSAAIPDIRFGLVTYNDASERDIDLTTNVADFKAKVNALYASGGGDYPEGVEKGLQTAYTSSWRSGDVAKVVVLIGDAPPHPADVPTAVSGASAAYTNEYGIYTNTIVCSTYADAVDAFQQIASAGHGTNATITDPTKVVSAITASIKTVVPSIDTAGSNVVVKEVVPSYIEATSFDPAPTTSSGNTYEWDFGTLGIGETKSITFNAQCTEAGDNKLVDVYLDTKLTYNGWDGSNFNKPLTLPFPETYINCKVSSVSNKPPVAEAGPNQVAKPTTKTGAAIILDGSGSIDDGKISPLTYTWTWNGGSATGVKPKIFLPLGTTKVTLTVFDGQFSSTDTVSITVKDSCILKPPVAVFSATPIKGKAPLTVKFTDKSTGSITSRSWNFGDKSTSTVKNPQHKYTKKGTYTVSLTVKNAAGKSIAKKSIYVTLK
jgi:PKD domain/von Willebrand factor type A domain